MLKLLVILFANIRLFFARTNLKVIKCQKLLLLHIIVSFRPILWPESHNSYKDFILKEQWSEELII